MGIIDSLSAGYRFLSGQLIVLFIPILLDLFLWWAPRLSIAPLLERMAAYYTEAASAPGMPESAVAMMNQVSQANQAFQAFMTMGQNSNLWDMLVSNTLLRVPSLMISVAPLPGATVVEIASPWAALGLALLFGVTGILIGALFMNLLALKLPLGNGPKQLSGWNFLRTVVRHWLSLVLFVALAACMLVFVSIPFAIGLAVLALVSPLLSSFFVLLMSGILVVILFYLYFVSAALIMDNLPLHRAVAQSFGLVRRNGWATLGFVLLTNLISLGFMLLLDRLAVIAPLGRMAAIGLNAYIGSGLAMALLVFYRTRLLRMAEEAAQLSRSQQ